MNAHAQRYAVQQVCLGALYVLGAWIATRFITLSDDVVLIWPPSGLTYAALLLYGLKAWPFIPLGALVAHLWFAPVPPLFLGFSMASNTVATLLAVWLVRRWSPGDLIAFTTPAGFRLLAGGLVQAVLGALIGAAGLVLAGMVPESAFMAVLLRWTLADIFGVIMVGPLALIAIRQLQRGGALLQVPGQPLHRPELVIWSLALLLALTLQGVLSELAPRNALVLSVLPAAMLMWSALRLAPICTGAGAMVVGLVVAAYANFGVAGFAAPAGIADIVVLLVFLSTLVVFPLTVATSQFESRRAASELLRRASIDRLTGLPNRVAFEQTAAQRIERGQHYPLALVYVDLDQFKVVNDTLGHAVGDQFLQGLAGALPTPATGDPVLARLGGDEFALLLGGMDATTAERWCVDLLTSIERYRMGHDGHVLGVTASIGLVPVPARGARFQEVFARADAACSAAKETGGNRVQLSTLDDAALADREAAMRWALRLNQAVEAEQFELYFQRILPLRSDLSNPGHKLEILLRLRDGAGRLLLPGRFIPALERLNLSSRLDRHVFDRVIAWFEAHPQASASPQRISVNLSASSLADQGLADHIERRLQHSRLAPQSLVFEITETGAVRDLRLARAFIQRVRALGCSVALDDFGAGYCSFAYLRDLPVDQLKIDGSFVRELEHSPLAMAVVRSMVDIARVLGMRTVAECVETLSLRDRLLELGVDDAQGYALHTPEPLEFLLRT